MLITVKKRLFSVRKQPFLCAHGYKLGDASRLWEVVAVSYKWNY